MPDNKKNKIPRHVAIIIDGNRRWAKERNLSSTDGHARGYERVKSVGEWFFSKNVKILSLFAFSTENWSRAQTEVNYLMKLLERVMRDDLEEFNRKNHRLLISGRVDELPGGLPAACKEAEDATKGNTGGILNLCINYGGRPEIVDAVKQMIKSGISADQVHEGMIKKHLYEPDLPDPDIIVRTSGEQRLSGFLLWQSAYSELLFLKKYWPDFEKSDVDYIIEEYNKRERRFGS